MATARPTRLAAFSGQQENVTVPSVAGPDPLKCLDRPSASCPSCPILGWQVVWYGHGACLQPRLPTPSLDFPARGLTVVPLWSEPRLLRAFQASGWWANWGHMCKMKLAASTSPGAPPAPALSLAVFSVCCPDKWKGGVARPRAAEQLSNAAVLRRPALTASSAPARCMRVLGVAGPGVACAATVQPASPLDTVEIQ